MAAVRVSKAQASGEKHKPESVQRRASLHPKAVSKATEGTPRRVKHKQKGRRAQVTVSKVDPRVWGKALVLAERHGLTAHHIEVVSPHEVIVRNRPVR